VAALVKAGADIRIKSDVYDEVMAVPPHGYLPYNKAIPHGGETALMFAARVGDLESMKHLVAAGGNVNDADAWGVSATVLAAHSGFGEMVEFLLAKGADANATKAGFSALQEAIMRRDEQMVKALLEHGANPNFAVQTWTPTRRSSQDFNFDPPLVGATPYWLAARFLQPNVMQMLAAKGADVKFVHKVDYTAEQGFGPVQRSEVATAVMAAVGAIRVFPWVEPEGRNREALTLETVKKALELAPETDLNVLNTDGRSALDGATALRYKTVVDFLTAKGAKPGKAPPAGAPKPRPTF
jgi:cytohesin